jgi:hypothetical protein
VINVIKSQGNSRYNKVSFLFINKTCRMALSITLII